MAARRAVLLELLDELDVTEGQIGGYKPGTTPTGGRQRWRRCPAKWIVRVAQAGRYSNYLDRLESLDYSDKADTADPVACVGSDLITKPLWRR